MRHLLTKATIILIILITGLTFQLGFELGSMLWDNFTTKIEETK